MIQNSISRRSNRSATGHDPVRSTCAPILFFLSSQRRRRRRRRRCWEGVDYPVDSEITRSRGDVRGGFRIQRRPPSLFVYSTVSVVGRLGQRQTARYCFINPAPCKKEAVHHPSVAGCTVYRCAPIIVSRSRRFIAAQFIREFASRWMNGVAA